MWVHLLTVESAVDRGEEERSPRQRVVKLSELPQIVG